ncbi:MAG: tRNA lysidine(34) synthetase TilS [Woeseiaceae bacterium]|nr:tRNA lysidine(34) synthetase TilS [Woeseiaceae bacterium]NIP19710.1 tRNA lysidine(34) synthetase TilS [Woeseiaceae bacterium]NIS89827.1 tRNA lysidine(34) synthetase TilS [Woeseiaceae bacterium]
MKFSRKSLLRELAGLAQLAGSPTRIVIAFSGGLDSTVLLHALATRADALDAKILAVHVDHGLHKKSREWSEHCERVVHDWNIEFVSLRVKVDRESGLGPEAAARTARYDALRRLVEAGDWLISAHHKDDQAETLLLNLMRGSGPAGLAGIGEVQPFAAGWLVRPLLPYSRRELLEYATKHELAWIDDPSNEDRSYDRNYLRHEVIPVIEARWPEASSRLRLSAQLAGEAATLLDQLAEADWHTLGDRPDALSLPLLRQLPPERQRNLIRYIVRELGLPSPPASVLHSIVDDLIPAREDAQPLVEWSGVQVRRYRDSVYLLQAGPAEPPATERMFEGGRVDLGPGCGELALESGASTGLSDTVVAAGLRVRFREGGEKIKLADQTHTKKLKKLLQEEGIVPWMRERLPLVYSAGELVAVADLWIADAAKSEPGTAVRWVNRPPLH